MNILCFLLLMLGGLALLLLLEDSPPARLLVIVMLGTGAGCLLHSLLPARALDWLPQLGRPRKIRLLALVLPCLALAWPLVSCLLYPLRDRLMQRRAR